MGSVTTFELGPFVALLAGDSDSPIPHVVTEGEAFAIGNVRLDTVPVGGGGTQAPNHEYPDALIALQSWLRCGHAALSSFVGDFALVMVDGRTKRLVACRDAFGVRLLVTRRVGSLQLFASLAWLLGGTGFCREYVADLILGAPTGTKTMFSNVTRVAAGSAIELTPGGCGHSTLWSSLEVPVGGSTADSEQFLSCFAEGIKTRTRGEERFWTQLSGGVDSSSVTSQAALLSRKGAVGLLGGAVTFADSLGDGDESLFSDAVATALSITNKKVVDYWPWRDDGEGPPELCDPHPFFAFYEMRRALCRIVRNDGARVMLTGIGSDHYLSGTYDFVADMLWDRQFREASRVLYAVAVHRKRSLWGLLRTHGVIPLLPLRIQARFVAEEDRIPSWFRRDFVQQCELKTRVAVPREQGVPRGDIARYQVDRALRSLDHGFTRGVYETQVEARHPFLHRPLVELCLSLSNTERIGPTSDKVVLRRTMEGILPDVVRKRSTKGSVDARIAWALHHENKKLRRLVDTSVLAQVGCVEPRRLGEALERCRLGLGANEIGALFATLSLESWLSAYTAKS